MKTARNLLFSLGLCFAGTVAAQVAPIPGSGCPNAPAVVVTGAPQIGTRISFNWRCSAGDLPILVFGELLRPPISIPTAITCGNVVCTLAVRPTVAVQGSANSILVIPVDIPNDPALIGAVVGSEGVCVSRGPLCLLVGQGVAVRVTR